VGDDGLILHTTDGGENWIVQISNVPSNLLGVRALGERRAIAVGLNGIILRTNDGDAPGRATSAERRHPCALLLRRATVSGQLDVTV
jgi:photosystem II stability/assembly factor-like uncharacterized protein